jgi:HSP20 family protein
MFSLPDTVKSEDVKAKYENGVLKIMVPKKETAKVAPKKEIKIG